MSKTEITTNLVGRKVKLGWSNKQALEWGQRNPGQSLENVKIIPAKYEQHGQKGGVIVGVFKEGGKAIYMIECEGAIMELIPDLNFDLLPVGP